MCSTDPASFFPRKQFRQNSNRSQGVVEFALALPILLVLLFGIIDFSLLFSAWLLIQNMSRQAVRYAVTGEFNATYCPPSNPACTTTKTDTVDQDNARLYSIRDKAMGFTVGLLVDPALEEAYGIIPPLTAQADPGYLKLTICSSRDTTGDNISNFLTKPGKMGSSQYSSCVKIDDNGVPQGYQEDPGGPGDTVIVIVDFNHPYITPFLNKDLADDPPRLGPAWGH